MHLFISYAKKDTGDLALKLADALNAIEGITAWVDRSLRAGESWQQQIQAEIDRCDLMIVLYSPEINRHKNGEPESYVLNEIEHAYRIGKEFIPIMIQPTDLPMRLVLKKYIDFTNGNLTLDDLVAEVRVEIGIATHTTKGLTSIGLMPAPFAWIEIPRKGYSIAKYLVTNAQFMKFIEAGGYHERKWWTELGWNAREEYGWTEPRYWMDAKWNGEDQPVIGVSWYEAVAFCLWLSDVTREKIMLPSLEQWQYAAQGKDGRYYPWGDDWDVSRCNNSADKKGMGVTTSVTRYEGKGDSAFGVVDMAGNVCEWCLTDHDNKSNGVNRKSEFRVLCGGSWNSISTDDFRCDFYSMAKSPHGRDDETGFRLTRLYAYV